MLDLNKLRMRRRWGDKAHRKFFCVVGLSSEEEQRGNCCLERFSVLCFYFKMREKRACLDAGRKQGEEA